MVPTGSATYVRIAGASPPRHLKSPLHPTSRFFPSRRAPQKGIMEKLAGFRVCETCRRSCELLGSLVCQPRRPLPRPCLPRTVRPGVSARADQPRAGPAARGPAPHPTAPTWRAGPLGDVTRNPRATGQARTQMDPSRGQIRHTGVDPGPVGGGSAAHGAATPTCDVEVVCVPLLFCCRSTAG